MADRFTPEEVRETFGYNANTGNLWWRKKRGRLPAGKLAGGMSDTGYLRVQWKGRKVRCHRIAWVHYHGKPIPEGFEIDHANRIRTDNRIENLRLATRGENAKNRGSSRSQTNVLIGIVWKKSKQHWRNTVYANGQRINVGSRSLFCLAVRAKQQWLRQGAALSGPFGADPLDAVAKHRNFWKLFRPSK
jgi:hypothetical protein